MRLALYRCACIIAFVAGLAIASGVNNIEVQPIHAADAEALRTSRQMITGVLRSHRDRNAPEEVLRPFQRGLAALTLYETGAFSRPQPYFANVMQSTETDAWFLAFHWIDDGNTIPAFNVMNRSGEIVGEFESRPYPQDELPDTLIRSRMVVLSGPGDHAASDDFKMPVIDVSVPPHEIAGLFFRDEGHSSYVSVLQPNAPE